MAERSTTADPFFASAPGAAPTPADARAAEPARRRAALYWAVGIGLVLVSVALREVGWTGSQALHTVMETAATLLAAVVGTLALVRYYTRKTNLFLFIGTGFIGTAFLDGFHAIVTAEFFIVLFPSPPASLIPWSWVASRLFLAVMLWLGWLTWHRARERGHGSLVAERTVYLVAGGLMIATFVLFAFVPLPPAYYPELYFPRPEEIVPAVFFALALVGYLRRGEWKSDPFEHWLVLSLVVNLVLQVPIMAASATVFDTGFNLAHLLKKVAYLAVLTGLMVSIYRLFREAQGEAERDLESVLDQAREGIHVLAASSREILEATSSLASAANQSMSSVSETTATVEEIRHSAETASREARRVAESATQASRVSEEGRQAVESAVTGIERVREQMESLASAVGLLGERSAAIGEMLALVNELAEQSNVLAVNAAVEAARAGEQGRGFEVVAREMRSLAERSKVATADIRGLLREVVEATEGAVDRTEESTSRVVEGAEQASRAGEAIRTLERTIGETTRAISGIAAASDEQAAGMRQIAVATESLREAAETNVDSIASVESAVREVDALGHRLKALIDRHAN